MAQASIRNFLQKKKKKLELLLENNVYQPKV